MNVLLTGSLVLLLLLLFVLKHRAKQAPRAEQPSEPDASVMTRLSHSLARVGRQTHAEAPDPPRKRRNRPKLGLSVTGLPAVESLQRQHAIAHPGPASSADDGNAACQALGDDLPNDEQVASTSPSEIGDADHRPIEQDIASYVDSVAPVPLPSVRTETDPTVEATLSKGGAPVFIDAPGWPQPGEMGLALESFDPPSGPSIALGTALPGEDGERLDDHADSGDDAASGSARWGGEDDLFDPARGWSDYAVATDRVPNSPPAEWTSDVTTVTHGVADAVNGQQSTNWDAHAWDEPDWSWEPAEGEADAAPVVEAAPEGNAPHVEVTWDEAAAERATPATEDACEAGEAPDAHTVTEAAIEWTAAATEGPATLDEAVPTLDLSMTGVAVPVAQPATKRDKRTRRLEQRLAVAEAKLERIAKRTTGKKGDLRKAGKKTIAKQVRKALADPEMAHHFDVRVGKGRISFARRADELPVLGVESAPAPSTSGASAGADILAALQSPLRASLLAGLLADYANAEAERRVAEVLRHAGPRHTPDDFDELVAQLAEVSRGPLPGIDPSERRGR